MYAYIRGVVSSVEPDQVVLEAGGVGYAVEIDLQTHQVIKDDEEAKLFIQLIVREDSHTLYGFSDLLGKQLFNKLISVSGIGPNTARVILSSMTRGEVIRAITTDQEAAFKKVKGVGPKTAKRIILDLRDKLVGLSASADEHEQALAGSQEGDVHEEAVAALVQLGFKKNHVNTVVNSLLESDPVSDVSTIIRLALAQLTGGRKS